MAPTRRLDALTGLRFIAAAAVLIAHLPIVPSADSFKSLEASLFRFRAEGFVGVSFFFVLSGFVLAYSYHDRLARPTRRALGEYFLARFARVWPLHLLLIGLFVLTAHPLAGPAHLFANLLLVQTWIPSSDFFLSSYNGVTWSLSVEAFFYLTLPLYLRSAARLQAGPMRFIIAAVGLGAITASVVFALAGTAGLRTTYLLGICPLGRLPEFLVGVWLGIAFVRSKASTTQPPQQSRVAWTLVELLLVAVMVGLLFASESFPLLFRVNGYYTLTLAAIVFCFACQRGALSRFMASRTMVYLGEISFALFISHPFVFGLIDSRVPLGESLLGQFLVLGLPSLASAVLLHHACEKPARYWLLARSRRKRSRPAIDGWFALLGFRMRSEK